MLRCIHNLNYTKSAAGSGHKYIYTLLVLLLKNKSGLVHAVFFQLEVVDERNRGVFVVENV